MGKIGKLLIFLLLLVVAAVVALGAFVHFYLTEDRLLSLLIPPAEKTLGRQVTIDSIEVSLFSGVKVRRLAIKEANGKDDFATVDTVVLSYNLWKLLQKQIAISEITLERPQIKVFRDRQGRFNYESLAVLHPDAAPAAAASPAEKSSPALPLAVTISAISVDHAVFQFIDQQQQLPTVQGEADLKMALKLGQTLSSWRYHGLLQLHVTARQQQLQPQLQGELKFDQEQLTYDFTITQEQEKLRLQGQVNDYFTGPTIIANLSSPSLHLDYLAGLTGTAAEPRPAGNGKKAAPAAGNRAAGQSPLAGLPPKLVVKGRISCDQASYRDLKIADFQADYLYRNRVLTVNGLKGRLAEGIFTGQATLNLQKAEPAYQGNFSLAGVQVPALLAMTAPAAAGMISGTLASNWTFNGRGTDSEAIKRQLSADGTYTIKDGQLRDVPATTMIATLLDLPSLEKIAFSTIDGNFHLRRGRIQLNSKMNAEQLTARTTGSIGLDGSLQLPVNLTLGKDLSQRLMRRYPWMKELSDQKGRTTIDLQVKGTLSRPQASLNQKTTEKQVEKVIQQKLFEKLNRSLQKGKHGQR